MTEITVAATQMACSWDLERNVENAVELVREAAGRGAQIVLIRKVPDGLGLGFGICSCAAIGFAKSIATGAGTAPLV